MKLKNVSSAAVQVVDEHSGRGALVEPGGETPELSEQACRELLELKAIWKPIAPTSVGKKKKES